MVVEKVYAIGAFIIREDISIRNFAALSVPDGWRKFHFFAYL